MRRMRNLADVRASAETDALVEPELVRAQITVVRHPEVLPGEVKTRLSGRLDDFTFERAWTYWVAKGPMPLALARRLYADPVGREDLRVDGDAGAPPPDERAIYYDATGCELIDDPTGTVEARWRDDMEAVNGKPPNGIPEACRFRFVPNAKAVAARAIVKGYHIDSELGLYIFAQAVRRHASRCGSLVWPG